MRLDICGYTTVESPTPQQIRDAVLGLDTSGDAFLILSSSEMTYIQCSGDSKVGFDLEYQEGSVDAHYRASRNDWDAETIIRKFAQYCEADIAWREGVEWEKITW